MSNGWSLAIYIASVTMQNVAMVNANIILLDLTKIVIKFHL